MRRGMGWVSALLLLVATSAWSATPRANPAARGAKGSAGRGPRLASVTFGVRHRVFHDFRDLHTVKLNQDFQLGDGDDWARVIQYVPDFQMDLASRKVVSMSDQPRNPAFKIVVRRGKVPQDTTWAFLKSPPHFGAHSYFAFQVIRIDFVGHPPLLPDTTSAAPPAKTSQAVAAPKDSARGH